MKKEFKANLGEAKFKHAPIEIFKKRFLSNMPPLKSSIKDFCQTQWLFSIKENLPQTDFARKPANLWQMDHLGQPQEAAEAMNIIQLRTYCQSFY